MQNQKTSWKICPECNGQGKKRRRLNKKAQHRYQIALVQFKKNNNKGTPPSRPKGHISPCTNCTGSGILPTDTYPAPDIENYPHLAIIGGGIGGTALAVACLHRGIPFTLYERDTSFGERSQGYGLTLQQASKAMEGFGITSLKKGVVSTKHLVHTTQGKIIGEWGMRKWMQPDAAVTPKRTNVHIARQSLRLALLEQLGGHEAVQWGHQFMDYDESNDKEITLRFQVNGQIKSAKADLVVGADGIRSTIRKLAIDPDHTPLHYLGCIVILGICPLEALKDIDSPLLDSATVFQTANGNERIYMMPYAADTIMWQLSFPISEKEAKTLSSLGPEALKKEACLRTQWHSPIPQILAATQEAQISGYPVYDREVLRPEAIASSKHITLIGDAAHPMSPFKGQGANQALLDALSLARTITKGCRPLSQWRDHGIRKNVLTEFESEMIARTTPKVKDSAKAARLLHSENVLQEGNQPRGRDLNKKGS